MEHSGSRGTYDYIAKWISPDFFFSVNDKWDRFGMLGVFGDYILSCTPGDIFEIGVGESSIYLSALARKYNRKIYYCDISASKIDNPMTIEGYLAPERAAFFRCESDKMFKEIGNIQIAVGFIDGNHLYEFVKNDFNNLLPVIVDDGWIILHDTNPLNEEYLDENHCGTVYKLREEIEQNKDLDCITLTKGCAMGVGLTLCRIRSKNRKYFQA